MTDPAPNPPGTTNNALRAEGVMARMWAGWRLPYITGNEDPRVDAVPEGTVVALRPTPRPLPDG